MLKSPALKKARALSPSFDFNELKRLYDMGFALHWLMPNSKRPIEKKWSTTPRASWREFKAQYRDGYNVGVKLGAASQVNGKYLAVIDVDVKSDDPRHAREAKKKVKELFPAASVSAMVLSGRGNGSAHYYVLTNEPHEGSDRKSSSSERVKVKMPSVDPSGTDKKYLTSEELKLGLRSRCAWEVGLMSSGRQVVLPGSVHPDTGRLYEWASFELPEEFPRIKIPKTREEKKEYEDGGEIEFDDSVSLKSLKLRPEQIAALKDGDDVDDRSAACFSLCMAMLQRGVKENVILSILTNRDYYLGATGFDHAKTENRIRAAKWIRKYCLAKAKDKVAESEILSDVFELEEGEEIEEWQKDLDYTQTRPAKLRPTFKNVLRIFENTIGDGFLKENLFTRNQEFTEATPWGGEPGQLRSGGDADALRAKEWLINKFKMEVNLNTCEETFNLLAEKNAYHPVKDYLESLEWDGVPRISRAFIDYLGAKNMPVVYLKAVSRKFFMALVGRIYEPGLKFDSFPVLGFTRGLDLTGDLEGRSR